MANDLDQSVSNAIAGGFSTPVDLFAWALRKSGLPGDYTKPVGGSDWMREKGLTAPVKETGPAIVGETLGNLADPLAGVGKGITALKAGLYANALRPELIASHSVELRKLMLGGQLPRELYNPSFAVTKDRLANFHGSESINLIPKEGVLDPKTSPSVLTAFDSYSPRYRTASGHRVDSMADELGQYLGSDFDKLAPIEQGRLIQTLLRENANARLADKFVSSYPKGGIFGESSGKPGVVSLPQYGKGGYKFDIQRPPSATEPLQAFSYGHRFPDFKTFEKSPGGAGRLDDGLSADTVYEKIDKLLDIGRYSDFPVDTKLQALKSIAQDNKIGTVASKVRALNPAATKEAQQLLKELRRTYSDYAELKGYGPFQINSNNFAGIINQGNTSEAANWFKIGSEQLRKEAKKRGVPYEELPSPIGMVTLEDYDKLEMHAKKMYELAQQMQALRK